jgi:acetoin utilization deacetylase AcuC-like enzyme
VIPFVWSDAVLLHDPRHEVWAGRETPASECPRRAEVIRDALLAAGHPELPAHRHDDDALTAVHEPGLLAWLQESAKTVIDSPLRGPADSPHPGSGDTLYGEPAGSPYPGPADSPYPGLVGPDRVLPSVFPTPMMTAGMPWRYPASRQARAGVWCYDTMTEVGPGTWDAARAAVDVALTATDLVLSGTTPAAYALCRPPGHHATPAGFGGSCYLNNAAIAAQRLSALGRRVAVIDVDAHHGNGTQAVFWQRPDVFYGSVHVDPGAGWFPHIQGYADEVGDGPGAGTTRNEPLAPGTGDLEWLEAVARLAEAAIRFRAEALVISLGLDAADDDPESPLRVTRSGYAGAGRLLAGLQLPTVLIQEGGYHLPTLGSLVADVLAGFAPWSE